MGVENAAWRQLYKYILDVCFAFQFAAKKYKGRVERQSGLHCVSWYPFQMLARLCGASLMALGLERVVFSSRCDASCWSPHMLGLFYPNTPKALWQASTTFWTRSHSCQNQKNLLFSACQGLVARPACPCLSPHHFKSQATRMLKNKIIKIMSLALFGNSVCMLVASTMNILLCVLKSSGGTIWHRVRLPIL